MFECTYVDKDGNPVSIMVGTEKEANEICRHQSSAGRAASWSFDDGWRIETVKFNPCTIEWKVVHLCPVTTARSRRDGTIELTNSEDDTVFYLTPQAYAALRAMP